MKIISAIFLSLIVAGATNASVTESGWYGYGGSGPVALVDGVYWCYQECEGGVRILGFDDGDDCSYAYAPGAYKKQNGYLVCVSGNVTIPSTINNKAVVEIGSCAFYDCTGVTSITIPSSVLRITGGAFEGCSALTQVSGGLSVQDVNGAAFNGCSKLITDGKIIWRNFFVTGADCVGDVVIPDGVTTICSSAFSKNSGSRVLSITIPQTVTSVGSSAFSGCDKLLELRIPSGVTQIGSYAFTSCPNLARLVFDGPVPSVGYNAFYNLPSTLYVSEGQETWKPYIGSKWQGLKVVSKESSTKSVLFDARGGTAERSSLFVESGSKLGVLPSASLLGYRFDGWFTSSIGGQQITSDWIITDHERFYAHWSKISIGDVIGEGRYQFTTSSDSEWQAGDDYARSGTRHSYYDNSWLQTKITGPAKVSFSWKYDGEYGMVSFYLDGSICRSLGETWDYVNGGYYWEDFSFDVPEGEHTIKWACSGDCDDFGNYGYGYLKEFKVVQKLSDWDFEENGDGTITLKGISVQPVGAITIPSEIAGMPVSVLGEKMLLQQTSVTSVTIPNTVKKIGRGAFSGCRYMKTVSIPSSVVEIGDSAFSGCSALESVTLPEQLQVLGSWALSGCSSLKSVTIPSTITEIPANLLSGCSGLTSISISEKAKKIGASAFDGCTSLASFVIPNEVEYVGEYAFKDCTVLASLTFPASVTHVGAGAFRGCSSMEKLYLTDIKAYCNADYETEGRSQEDDDYYDSTPLYCSKATTLYLNGTAVTDLIIPEGTVNIPHHAFHNLTTVQSVAIPSTLKSSSDGAFSGWSSLKRVSIADVDAWFRIKAIGRLTYDGLYCSDWLPTQIHTSPTLYVDGVAVDSIVIPSDITYLSDCALGFGNVKSVAFPPGLTSLGTELRFCGIESVVIPEGVTSIASGAFAGCKNLRYVSLPKTLEIVGNAFYSCPNLRRVEFNCPGVKLYRSAFEGYTSGVGYTENLESMVFHGHAPMIYTYGYWDDSLEESQLSTYTSKAIIYADEGSEGWGVDIPGTWQGHSIKYSSPVKLSDCSFGGNADWVEDIGAFKSGKIFANQNSTLTYKVSGAGTFSFDWRVSSESGCDKLSVLLDGNVISGISAISGERSWAAASFVIDTAGEHEITWKYSKDGSGNSGSDCGWVRDFAMKQLSTITLTFDSNGGSPVADKTMFSGMTAGNLPIPTRTGYAFDGWQSSVLGKIVSSTTVLNHDDSMLAMWTANSYKVTFNPGLGTVSEASRMVTYDAKFNELPVPVRNGYFFTGWYDANGNHITGDAICKLTSAQSLTARWIESVSHNNQYGDGYWRDGGSGYWDSALQIKVSGTGQLSYEYKFSDGGATFNVYVDDVLYERLAETGYWGEGEKKTVNILTSGSHVVKFEMDVDDYGDDYGYGESMVSELKYTTRSFSTHYVYFQANSGLVSPSSKIVAAGYEYGALPDATREGAYFDGWYTDITGGTRVTADSIVQSASYEYLYAHWRFISYPISYQNLGGASNPNPSSYTIVDEFSFQPPKSTQGSYFLGWSLPGISAGTANPLTVKARWLIVPAYDNATVDLNGKCTIKYTVSSDMAIPECDVDVYYAVRGQTNLASSVSGDMSMAVGDHVLIWDMKADGVSGAALVGLMIRREAGPAQSATFALQSAWPIDSQTKYLGESARRSPEIGDDGETEMSALVSGVGTLSFAWKASSEYGYDILSFLVDGAEYANVSGVNNDFVKKSFDLGGGDHIVTWRYKKDGSDFSGVDGCWVAAIEHEKAVYSELRVVAPVGSTGLPIDEVLGEGSWEVSDVMYVCGCADKTARKGASVEITSDPGTNQCLKLTVDGPGRIDFDWKVSSLVVNGNIINGISCEVDGQERMRIGGEQGWDSVSCVVEGAGEHTIVWRYTEKGSLPQLGFADVAWIANVAYHPQVTLTFTGVGDEIGKLPEAINTYEGEEVTLPMAEGFTRAFSKFVGWSDGSEVYQAGAIYPVANGSCDFVAVWEDSRASKPTIKAVTPYAATDVLITIESEEQGTVVHYSVDGAEYAVYEAPFTLVGEHVVRAYCTKPNCHDSEVVELEVARCVYEVRFNPGERGKITSGACEQSVRYGDAAIAPVVEVTDSWYEFDSWDCAFNSVTADTVVTAVYRKRPFNIHFGKGDADGEQTVMGDLSYYQGEPITLPACSYKWSKHEFVGWKYGNAIYQPGDKLSYDGANLDCVAVWAEKRLAKPVVSPDYFEGENVEVTIVTTDAEASIIYTTDGSEPSADHGVHYAGAFVISETTEVKAIAIRNDWFDSDVVSQSVVRGPWTFAEYLECANVQFETGGASPWTRTKVVASVEGYYLTSGCLGNKESNYLSAVVKGEGKLKFRFKASVENWPGIIDLDYFRLYVDGNPLSSWSGETDWQVYECDIIGEGEHVLKWAYEKDDGDTLESDFDNCVWLDYVSWKPTTDCVISGIEELALVFGPENDAVKNIKDDAELAVFNGFLKDCSIMSSADLSAAQKQWAYMSFKLSEVTTAPQLFEEEPILKIDDIELSGGNLSLTISLTAGAEAIQLAKGKLGEKIRVGSTLGDITCKPTIVTRPAADGISLTFTVNPPVGNQGFVRVIID